MWKYIPHRGQMVHIRVGHFWGLDIRVGQFGGLDIREGHFWGLEFFIGTGNSQVGSFHQ